MVDEQSYLYLIFDFTSIMEDGEDRFPGGWHLITRVISMVFVELVQ